LGAADPAPAITAHIPMRDGAKLATDIYLPGQDQEKRPCVLIRTPYGRTRYNREFGGFSRGGYAIAIQDTRGRFDSEGKAMAFQSDGWGEQQDGYDTVEWLARQPFCNGKVGTMGASAMGIVQTLMAPAAPPSLVCQYISVSPASLYHEAIYQGGVFRKNQVENWMRGNAHPDALKLALAHPDYDSFWEGFDINTQVQKIGVPALHYGGWFDTFCDGTINNFLARQQKGGAGAKTKQKLIMGPWTHGGPGRREFGDFELPEPARRVPVNISAKRWFDFYLKGVANDMEGIPAIHYYVMGPLDGSPSSGNRWKTAASWPVPTQAVPFYLGANRELTRGKPPASQGQVSFLHNPANPVPTIGGRNLSLPPGPKDQRELERRPDVLVFTTSPLEEDLEVTGKITAKVFVAAAAAEIHVAARLCDVYPDGRSILIGEGIKRVKLPPENQAINQAGIKPMAVEVDLWSTSMVFAKGHQIRLSLCGSNYPRWEVCKASNAPVRTTIFVGEPDASRLILPTVPPMTK
jgi:predicted acyl esterase